MTIHGDELHCYYYQYRLYSFGGLQRKPLFSHLDQNELKVLGFVQMMLGKNLHHILHLTFHHKAHNHSTGYRDLI